MGGVVSIGGGEFDGSGVAVVVEVGDSVGVSFVGVDCSGVEVSVGSLLCDFWELVSVVVVVDCEGVGFVGVSVDVGFGFGSVGVSGVFEACFEGSCELVVSDEWVGECVEFGGEVVDVFGGEGVFVGGGEEVFFGDVLVGEVGDCVFHFVFEEVFWVVEDVLVDGVVSGDEDCEAAGFSSACSAELLPEAHSGSGVACVDGGVDAAYVDSDFEGVCGDDCVDGVVFESLFDVSAVFVGVACVVGFDFDVGSVVGFFEVFFGLFGDLFCEFSAWDEGEGLGVEGGDVGGESAGFGVG